MSHGNPPLPGPPPPPPLPAHIKALGEMERRERARHIRAQALLAAATLLGPVLAADATAGRVGPLTGNDLRAILTHAERAWLKLAGQAEAWITGGDGS